MLYLSNPFATSQQAALLLDVDCTSSTMLLFVALLRDYANDSKSQNTAVFISGLLIQQEYHLNNMSKGL